MQSSLSVPAHIIPTPLRKASQFPLFLIFLQAMISVLCCGPCFDERTLREDGGLYTFLDVLLSSKEKKVGGQVLVLKSALYDDSGKRN